MKRYLKPISIAVYILGCAAVVFLIIYSIYGSDEYINYDINAMMNPTWRDTAAIALFLGTVPMFCASLAFLQHAWKYLESEDKWVRWLIANIPAFICVISPFVIVKLW